MLSFVYFSFPVSFVPMAGVCITEVLLTQVSTQDSGINELLATAVSDGVERLCQCGFSTGNIDQTILQCFPDTQEKINALLLIRPTPSKNSSEILDFMRTWINENPQIMFNESNTTLSIDRDCDVGIIHGSECNTDPTTENSNPTTNTTNRPTSPTSDVTLAKSESKGQGAAIAGGVLISLAIIIAVATAVVIVVVWVRYRRVTVGSFML